MKVHLFRLSTGTLEEVQLLSQDGEVTCVAYSPDGAYLASGDSNRKVCLYDAADSYKVSRRGSRGAMLLLKISFLSKSHKANPVTLRKRE